MMTPLCRAFSNVFGNSRTKDLQQDGAAQIAFKRAPHQISAFIVEVAWVGD